MRGQVPYLPYIAIGATRCLTLAPCKLCLILRRALRLAFFEGDIALIPIRASAEAMTA
jgi:hypothetical protein